MEKIISKPKIIYLIILVFFTVLGACDSKNNANAAKKTDPAVQQNVQPNVQRSDEYGVGMDTFHRGMGPNMGGNHRGMDSIHRKMGPNMGDKH